MVALTDFGALTWARLSDPSESFSPVSTGLAGGPAGLVASWKGGLRAELRGSRLIMTTKEGGSAIFEAVTDARADQLLDALWPKDKAAKDIFGALGVNLRAPDAPVPDLGSVDASRRRAFEATAGFDDVSVDFYFKGGDGAAVKIAGAKDVTPPQGGNQIQLTFDQRGNKSTYTYSRLGDGFYVRSPYSTPKHPLGILVSSDATTTSELFKAVGALRAGATGGDLRDAFRAVTGR